MRLREFKIVIEYNDGDNDIFHVLQKNDFDPAPKLTKKEIELMGRFLEKIGMPAWLFTESEQYHE